MPEVKIWIRSIIEAAAGARVGSKWKQQVDGGKLGAGAGDCDRF